MSSYVDHGDMAHNQRATVTVVEDTRTIRVMYRGENGTRFRVLVHQKPNPIGFHARLPGDKRPNR